MQDEVIPSRIRTLARHPEGLRSLEPREFEQVIAEMLASQGYEVQVTPPTRDGGYDILAVRRDPLGIETTTVVECKRYSQDRKVPISHVRGLYGVKSFLGVSNAVLVTTSSFTDEAKKFVQSKYDIQLLDYSNLARWLKTYVQPPDAIPYADTRTFYSCFISHSSADKDFVERLNESLRAAGVKVWYAPEELVPGQKLREQIRKAIKSFDKLLLVLSEDSICSNWVSTEIRDAKKREKEEERQVLFPIAIVPMDTLRKWECFDADTGRDMAVEIREYFIPDMSEWSNEAKYNDQFKRLLKGLRKDDPGH